MARNLNTNDQEIKQEVVKMINYDEQYLNANNSFSIKIEAKKLQQELCKSDSLKVITNVCQNFQKQFENTITVNRPAFVPRKLRSKIKKRKPNIITTQYKDVTITETTKQKIELNIVEEEINHQVPETDQIINIKQEVSRNDCKVSVESDPEESLNLIELMNHRKTRKLKDTIKKENLQNQERLENSVSEIEKQTIPEIQINNSNKPLDLNAVDELNGITKPNNYSDDSESDDLQEFLDACEPKKSKHNPRQKPQLSEEQKAENERKKLERRTCTICNIVFAFPGGLRNHIRSKHTLEKPYSCEICGEQFSVQSSYSLHRRRHLGIKPHLCNLCGKTYLRKMDLRIHMQIHIPSKDKIRDVKCSFCSNVYTSKMNLKKHLLSKHTDASEWKHECKICNKRCFSATVLTHHMRQHNDDRKFKCVICGRGFFTKQNMNVHVRTHSASTSFNCQRCSNGYRSNEALQRHMLKVHGIGEEKPISVPTHFCRICKEGFRQRARLEQHVILHETGEEEYPYKCKKCTRSYKARNYFTIHMMDKHGVFIDDAYFKTHFKMTNLDPHENGDNHRKSDTEY